tara:strand:+ start:481 stop:651 length:171 start_codon:yes stop_codon:yes gene_type:complete
MSNYGKTYPLGSSEAMKQEPRLDEEYYLQDPLTFTRNYMKVLEDMYLEDSINEQYK